MLKNNYAANYVVFMTCNEGTLPVQNVQGRPYIVKRKEVDETLEQIRKQHPRSPLSDFRLLNLRTGEVVPIIIVESMVVNWGDENGSVTT